MLDVSHLTVTFSGTPLFEDISFRLTAGDRVGLTGRNGAGKTTLLRVIAGEEEYTGSISSNNKLKTGYLRQDIDFISGRTVLEEAYTAFEELRRAEKEIEELQISIQHSSNQEKAISDMERLNELLHKFEIDGGYTYQGKTERILKGLGFKTIDFNRLTDEFSGGWRMRIELAKLLLQDNVLLLLDEPTNHLDIHSIIWFENFLRNYKGMVLLVSHDRMFLDKVTNRTLEIVSGKMYDVRKNYSGYLRFREERIASQLARKKNQEKEIKEMQRLIERFRYKATKASFAQSLIKKLEKMEIVEVDQIEVSTMHLKFPEAEPPGKVIFTLEKVKKAFGDKLVFTDVNFIIERGARIAFVGQNGMGKTTLARIMHGDLEYEGVCRKGHGVKIGYFAQNQAEILNPQNTVLEEMESASNDANRIRIRDILGSFLFSGDEVNKKVSVLSGGERNRLALAKMLLESYNVIIMDEPTNHLDMVSKEVLKSALKSFGGSLIIVSHDREFLKGLTDRIYEFSHHRVTEFLGGIEEYLADRNWDNLRELEASNSPTEVVVKKNMENDYKALKRHKNKISKIEKTIDDLETKISHLDAMLADGSYKRFDEKEFFTKYEHLKSELEENMKIWEDLHEDL